MTYLIFLGIVEPHLEIPGNIYLKKLGKFYLKNLGIFYLKFLGKKYLKLLPENSRWGSTIPEKFRYDNTWIFQVFYT